MFSQGFWRHANRKNSEFYISNYWAWKRKDLKKLRKSCCGNLVWYEHIFLCYSTKIVWDNESVSGVHVTGRNPDNCIYFIFHIDVMQIFRFIVLFIGSLIKVLNWGIITSWGTQGWTFWWLLTSVHMAKGYLRHTPAVPLEEDRGASVCSYTVTSAVTEIHWGHRDLEIIC